MLAFFWTHTALWFRREYKDRKQGKNKLHVQMDELPLAEERYVRRWAPMWRLAHLLLTLAVMTLDMRTLYLKNLTLIGCTAWDQPVFPNLISYIEGGELRHFLESTPSWA